MGFSEDDIVLDVIVDSAPEIGEVDASRYNSIQMVWRSMEVVNYYGARDGILKAQKAYPKVQFRNIVGPNQSWTTFDLDH